VQVEISHRRLVYAAFLCAAVWLALGLLAGWIVGLLLPGRRWTLKQQGSCS
jgi:hypothetical protein